MKNFLLVFTAGLVGSSLHAQSTATDSTSALFDGNLYSRFAVTYQSADDYYSGYDSFASGVFDNNEGEYSFVNYTLDLIYITKSGFFIGSGVYLTSADVETNGEGGLTGVPNTNSDPEIREVPLTIGYNFKAASVDWRVQARYIFNVDDDFDLSAADAIADAVILPVTDGSDSLTLSARAKKELAGLEHSVTLGYTFYEDDVSHPLFPEFSIGDRFVVDYEASKVFDKLKVSLGHLASFNRETKGNYLTEKPRFAELRLTGTYRLTPRFLIDAGVKYSYTGKDSPKQETFYLGAAYIF